MTRNELAKKLKVTPKTIFEWQKRGCPKTKILTRFSKWRWDFSIVEIEQWLEEQKGKSE
jgi:phage terminase Nu1 subunit (DNA packaging protein)